MSTSPQTPLSASNVFARSQGLECSGRWKCHWCGSPATNEWIHDDPPPVPFVRSKSTAKCPGESYVCVGCWAWRRQRVTVNFLSGGYLDRQEAKNHSWLVTESIALAIRLDDLLDVAELYEKLIKPPKRFFLSLRASTGVDTLLQLALLNNYEGMHADMPLNFTINNVPHTYSVYELTEAIKNGSQNYGPGVRALIRELGEPPAEIKKRLSPPPEQIVEKKGAGRPKPKEDAKYTSRKVIVASGVKEEAA